MSRGPYDGITVIELGDGLSSRYAGMLLSDRGADVIRIEQPRPPASRVAEPVLAAETKRAQWLDRGKRSLLLALGSSQLRDAGGADSDGTAVVALLHAILDRADVLLSDWPLPRLRELGLDADALGLRHPRLQLVRDAGFGDDGPLAGAAVTDLVVQARSGLLAGEGKLRADGVTPERLFSTDMAGFSTGVMLSLAVASALLRREMQTDAATADEVVVSQFAVAIALQSARTTDNPAADRLRMLAQAKLAAARAEGADFAALRAARADAAVPPGNIFYRPYRTRDGAVFVGALSKPLRDKVRRVLGTTYLYRDDPRFDPANVEFMAECIAQEQRTEAQFRTRDSADWVADFDAAGVPCGEVVFPEDLATSAQVLDNGYMVRLTHTRDGEQSQVTSPAQFARWPAPQAAPAPLPGADTEAVLARAGVAAEMIALLRQRGVVG